MAISAAVSAGAMKIGSLLQGIGKGIGAGVRSTVGTGKDVAAKTRKKIIDNSKKIKAEKAKQSDLTKKEREELERRRREDTIEGNNVKKKAPLTMKAVLIEKPLSFMSYLFTAWIIRNGPRILKEIEIFTKKVRVFVGVIKRTPGAIAGVVKAAVKFAKVIVANVLNFDFADREKKIKAAKEEYDQEMKMLTVTFSELTNVWNREENTLDEMIKKLDNDQSVAAALEAAGMEDFDLGFLPQNPIVGSQPVPQLGGSQAQASSGSDKVRALLDTISYAEGTPSYGTIYGGAVVPELAAGELTVAEVLNMQKTGKVRGRDAGYADDQYNSDATGRYQFMSYVLKEEVEKQGISMSEKFTPALQDKLILGRIARMRGVTQEKIEKEGLSEDIIDRLAPEFASFPNLVGPDAQGRTGTNTSYYGQGGKSKEQLQANYNLNQNRQQEMAAKVQAPQPAAPVGQTNVLDEFKGGQSNKIVETSGYGMRIHPVTGERKHHAGIDIAPPGPGYKVALKVPGKVTRVDNDVNGYGHFVIITSKETGMSYMFAHLKTVYVKVGDTYRGQAIGEIGNTGRGTGIHLHYEVYKGGKDGPEVDPKPYIGLLSIGKGTSKTQAVKTPLANNSINKNTRTAQLNAISSRTTGGTQTKTTIVTVKQKEVILVD